MSKNTVPVGQTPVQRYANWAEHRAEMRRDAAANRRKRRPVRE